MKQQRESNGTLLARLWFYAAQHKDEVKNCRCGCGHPATHIIEGIDLDGTYYIEGACVSVLPYLVECAKEMGYPFVAVGLSGNLPVLVRVEKRLT